MRLLESHLADGSSFCTSASVFAETLVRPLERGSDAVVEDFFDAVPIAVLPVDRDLARQAAILRARHPQLRLPDALVLATAYDQGAVLLTFDRQLTKLAPSVPHAD